MQEHRSPVRSWAVAAIVTVVVGGIAIVSANHAWGNYHWARSGNPVVLDVGRNVPATWLPRLSEAVFDWNGSAVLDLTVVPGGTSSRRCKPTTGRIEVCADTYGNNGWLGLAQIWVSGDHITQAIAKMNDTYFGNAPYNTDAWRQLVMCQEIGHDFGLDHQDEDFNNPNLGTCMDYTSDPSTNQQPNQHDYDQLLEIYSHLDGSSGGGGGRGNSGRGGGPARVSLPPPAMGQIDFATPEQWGELVSQTANGRGAVYELDFGGGFRVLTHVLWADPDADTR